MRNNSVKLFELGPVLQILFKDSYLELLMPFCSAEPNNKCNFVKGIMKNNWTSGSGDVV